MLSIKQLALTFALAVLIAMTSLNVATVASLTRAKAIVGVAGAE